MERTWRRSAGALLGSITIEPLCLLMAFGYAMLDITRQDFLYRNVCVTLYNLGECATTASNGRNETAKDKIESTTANYIQGYTIMEAVVPSILSLIAGPWTDVNGRKWPLVRLL